MPTNFFLSDMSLHHSITVLKLKYVHNFQKIHHFIMQGKTSGLIVVSVSCLRLNFITLYFIVNELFIYLLIKFYIFKSTVVVISSKISTRLANIRYRYL